MSSVLNDGSKVVPLDRQDERVGPGASWRDFATRLRESDLGFMPVIIGILVIFAVFQALNKYFLSSSNLVDLAANCAAVGIIALGIVLVLLLGEIDLSVGSMSGVASSILGVGLVVHGFPIWAVLLTSLVVGAIVGILYGTVFIWFGVPSFVITLAGLLALLGLQLALLGSNGSINLPFDSFLVTFMQVTYLPPFLSYLLGLVGCGSYAWSSLRRRARRLRHGLSARSIVDIATRACLLLVFLVIAAWYLNRDRGVSAAFVFFLGVLVVLNYLLTRTSWGRAVFAVGGSVEAARRAGINVRWVYMSVFALCSTLAALGGLMSAGRLATSSMNSGTGDTNLTAIAAAVIGGTSLFGGRGSAWSALLGIVVILSISSGLTLLNLDSSIRYIVTGGVLLAAVIVDSVTRRSRAAHGRA